MATTIRGYDALDRYLESKKESRSAFARRAGLDERDFRRVMQVRSARRRFSASFVEKVYAATGGAVDRALWIPS